MTETGDAWQHRQQWIEAITGLREGDAISEQDRELLYREYDRMQQSVQEAMQGMAPEYAQRIRQDGKESADEWIHAQTHELGVENGRRLRQVLEELSFADQLELDQIGQGGR
ncbi:MAG TPA: hypothetical protein H9827_07600 [Candidatus Luteimonas excrementigallinarum]|nr:hypothetical protein [Candidatus Luteimonas excrementigallinarum]